MCVSKSLPIRYASLNLQLEDNSITITFGGVMAFFKTAVVRHQEQLDEEYLYGYVANEIANDHISPGLWTKALVASGGDDQKARILYIKYRFDMLKTEGCRE